MKLEKGKNWETNFQTRDLSSQRNQWTIFICLISNIFLTNEMLLISTNGKTSLFDPHKFITNYLNTDLPTIPQSAPTKG